MRTISLALRVGRAAPALVPWCASAILRDVIFVGRLAIFVTTCVVLMAGGVDAQMQWAPLTAVVHDARGPVQAAVVVLADPLGAEIQRVVTDPQGRATFAAVAPGRYTLRTSAPGAAPFDLPAAVTGALALEITIRVPTALTDRVVVVGSTPAEPTSRAGLAGDSLDALPVRVRTRGVQDAVATLPGWTTEDNGLVHARGVDDGFLYVIDGVPVYERLDALSGFAPDLASVAALDVITGYIPPEFGQKAGGVIEVRSASGADQWTSVMELAGGSDAAVDAVVTSGGPLNALASMRLGAVVSRSDRFLDAVHPDNLHNTGGQSRAFGHLDWAPRTTDHVGAGWGYGRAGFDVPSTALQDAVGQDQRQILRQGYLHATWQRTWSPSTITQVAFYHRRTHARLEPSLFDTPIRAEVARDLVRTGGLTALTHQRGAHVFKAGFEWQRLWLDESFAFAVTDLAVAEKADFRDAALRFTPDRPFRFEGRAMPSLWSLYAQDAWQLAPLVTVSGGVRLDRSALLIERWQWSPRLGVAIRAADDTVIRASLNRFFQPPQPEYLLLSSSPEARVLSPYVVGDEVGGATLEPERQWAGEVGVQHRVGPRAQVDLTYWRRRMIDVADPNVFAGTTIIFPNAVAKGRAQGLDLRVEMPRHRGWSAYANGSFARVVQMGPITGGLFLEDEVERLGPGVEFTPDHEQRFAAGAGVTWVHERSGLMTSVVGRYETGTPVPADEDDLDELLELPGAERVDLEAGRVRPRTLISLLASVPVARTDRIRASAGLQVLNLFDVEYAYNFGNPFSGTHFGAPRTIAVSLRVEFD
ncbi:MAG: TonB-dependent receptor [Acidobacteriota bacterium]